MSQLIVLNHLSLDGVMQAPGRPDEDTREGFRHGGWAMPRGNTLGAAAKPPDTVGALLFGRRTFDDFYGFWPNQSGNPFTAILNNMPKYVASRTLRRPLPWQNSTLLQGEAAEAVARLKREPGRDMLIMGSGQLIKSLLAHGLIDTFIVMIHPIVLGSGRRMFETSGPTVDFTLAGAEAAPNGVVIATYTRTVTDGGLGRID